MQRLLTAEVVICALMGGTPVAAQTANSEQCAEIRRSVARQIGDLTQQLEELRQENERKDRVVEFHRDRTVKAEDERDLSENALKSCVAVTPDATDPAVSSRYFAARDLFTEALSRLDDILNTLDRR